MIYTLRTELINWQSFVQNRRNHTRRCALKISITNAFSFNSPLGARDFMVYILVRLVNNYIVTRRVFIFFFFFLDSSVGA